MIMFVRAIASKFTINAVDLPRSTNFFSSQILLPIARQGVHVENGEESKVLLSSCFVGSFLISPTQHPTPAPPPLGDFQS